VQLITEGVKVGRRSPLYRGQSSTPKHTLSLGNKTMLVADDEIISDPDNDIFLVRCRGCGELFLPTRVGQKRCTEDCGRTTHRHKNRNAADRPFIAIDGEGGGANEYGQQNYLLLCASGITPDTRYEPLFENNRPLTTTKCLDYLLSLKANAKYVIFGLGYDITQMLRDVPEEYIKEILEGGYDAPTCSACGIRGGTRSLLAAGIPPGTGSVRVACPRPPASSASSSNSLISRPNS
jgi:hypothetical protein